MKAIALILLMMFAPGAWAGAYYVCTDANGKKAFQDTPCGSEVAQEKKYAKTAAMVSADAWYFSETSDPLTGQNKCSLTLSPVSMGLRNGELISVMVMMVKVDGEIALAVRTIGNHPLIHNDFTGLGMKVGNYEFRPFTVRYGQESVGYYATETDRVMTELSGSDSLQLRLRFWPYQQTMDSTAMAYKGFERGFSQLQACSA